MKDKIKVFEEQIKFYVGDILREHYNCSYQLGFSEKSIKSFMGSRVPYVFKKISRELLQVSPGSELENRIIDLIESNIKYLEFMESKSTNDIGRVNQFIYICMQTPDTFLNHIIGMIKRDNPELLEVKEDSHG